MAAARNGSSTRERTTARRAKTDAPMTSSRSLPTRCAEPRVGGHDRDLDERTDRPRRPDQLAGRAQLDEVEREVPVDRHRGRPDQQDGGEESGEGRMAEHDADRAEARQPRSARVAAKGERHDGQHEQRRDVDREHAGDAGALDERPGERDDHDERAGAPGAQAAVSVPIAADRLERPGVEDRGDPGEGHRGDGQGDGHREDAIDEGERGRGRRGDERSDRDDQPRAGEPVRQRHPRSVPRPGRRPPQAR